MKISLLNSVIDLPKFIILFILIFAFVSFVAYSNPRYNLNLFVVAGMASMTANIIYEIFIRNNVIYVDKKIHEVE